MTNSNRPFNFGMKEAKRDMENYGIKYCLDQLKNWIDYPPAEIMSEIINGYKHFVREELWRKYGLDM